MPPSLAAVLSRAVKLVEPTPEEERRVGRSSELVLKRVREAVKRVGVEAEVVLGGSYAKGTWLKGEADIDVFVKLPTALSREELEEIGVRIGKDALKDCHPALRYAEHPYVEASFREVKVNVVACYDVAKGEWRSAADRSPYHTELITESFDKTLRTETRLLKRFLKTLGLYGAEVKTQGFSGYVCEVFMLKYGSLKSFLTAAARFREREIVSLQPVDQEAVKRFAGPLIILDPVDLRRNLGAAFSPENVGRLILAAASFLKKPTIIFFQDRIAPVPYQDMLRSGLAEGLVAIVFSHAERAVDILWGQLRRSAAHLEKQLNGAGFRVLRSHPASDEHRTSALLFLLENTTLSSFRVQMGPRVTMKEDRERFLEKQRRTAELLWTGGDTRIYSLLRRKPVDVKDFLRWLLLERPSDSGVAPGLKKELTKSFEVYVGEKCIRLTERHGWMEEMVGKLATTERKTFGLY